MKTQNKSSNLTAVVLLVLSALFSISLLLQPFDFGAMGPGKDNLFYKLGKMLYSVYGFSSILIPVFLMIAGLSCFSAKWTARKTMRLLTALIPFFTCVITENICRSNIKYSGSSFSVIKLIVAIVTGVMMMVIEFLGIGIIADKIQQKHFGGSSSGNNSEKDSSNKQIKLPRMKIPGKNNSEITEKSEKNSVDDSNLELNGEINNDTKPAINPIFDEVFDETKVETQETELSEKTENQSDSENQDDFNSEKEGKDESPAETENQSEMDNEQTAQTSMITQEEFAALTATEDENDSQIDELEWNLPPQPETLPPEYDEYFDVDDKALEFPPQNDDESEKSQNQLSFTENDEEVEELSSEEISSSDEEVFNKNNESSKEYEDFSDETEFADENEFVESSEFEVQSNSYEYETDLDSDAESVETEG